MIRPLVSVIIPAYNLPDHTRKTLQSIVEQEYRPIEVILSDDCSPTSLEPLAREFQQYENELFRVKFYRQQSNLGMMDNFSFCVDQATGEYALPWGHDNWFVDPHFLVDAVQVMQSVPKCYVCVANCQLEGTTDTMLEIPERYKSQEQWIVLPGDTFVGMWGLLGRGAELGWSQTVVVNLSIARLMGAFEEPFIVDGMLSRRLAIPGDNGFSFLWVLASASYVAVTNRVVCVAGTPDTSYARTKQWGQLANDVMFVIFYNLYKSTLDGDFAEGVKRHARRFIYMQAPVNHFNLRVLRHYRCAPDAIWLMSLSYAKGWSFRNSVCVRYTMHYVSLVRHLWQAARRRELSSLVAKHKARGVRGVSATLFPFR